MKILLFQILFTIPMLWHNTPANAETSFLVRDTGNPSNVLTHRVILSTENLSNNTKLSNFGERFNCLSTSYLLIDTRADKPMDEKPEFDLRHTLFSRQPISLALKTNALLWLATIMNLEGEIFINPRFSASLGISWCPWFMNDKFAIRNLSILPEIRWWFRDAHKGHFAGVHLSAAWFNFKLGDYRYQDVKRPLIGGGITYGYYFDIASQWGVELSLGAGYVSMRYHRYHNIGNGAKIDTRLTSWLGIDRLSITFSYRIRNGA